MKCHYRDRLFPAYRCELIGTLMWACVIEVLIAVARMVIAPELEGFTPLSERTTATLGIILTGFTILLSLLAAPMVTTESQ